MGPRFRGDDTVNAALAAACQNHLDRLRKSVLLIRRRHMARMPLDLVGRIVHGKGEAAFGKTRWTPVGPRLRAPRGRPAQSRRGYSGKDAPKEEWITIPVPALVDPALFEAVQEQLEENERRARIPEKGSRYVLQGFLVCAQCGYAYCGRTNDARNAYYRCAGP